MAEIKKISLHGTEYDICDATARADISKLNGKIQSGICTVPAGGNGEITFNPPFTDDPILTLTVCGSSTNTIAGVKIKTISKSKAEILVVASLNGNAPTAPDYTVLLHWIAYGA